MSQTRIYSFLYAIIFCMVSFISSAQQKSTNIQTINGKKYYIHVVEKGQSLYAISKIYGVDVNFILAENDEAIDGIKAGQELKILLSNQMVQNHTVADTNAFVYHKVAKGETLYSITKKYSKTEKQLQDLNPGLTANIKEGQLIAVAEKKQIKTTTPKENNHSLKDQINTYTVAHGETLYGICKKLNVLENDLLALNPEVKSGIKEGQILKLPANVKKIQVLNEPAVMELKETMTDTVVFNQNKKGTYNIGLFLPFKLGESELINVDEYIQANQSFPTLQSIAVDFYLGMKKAVDSLSSSGFEVNLLLFDVDDRDSARIESYCKSQDFKTLDLIIGPLYTSAFKIVSGNAKRLSIPIIAPITQQSKILYNNPFVSKVSPSIYTLIDGLADYTVDSLSTGTKVMIVNDASTKDHPYLKAFKKEYNARLLSKGKTLKDSIIEVKGLAGVKSTVDASKKNVVVLLTHNQVFLADFITQLYVFTEKKDITLMGYSSVSEIDNLDQEYLNKLQFSFASQNCIDYSDTLTLKLVKQYQSMMNTDPSDYYLEAFDIGFYALKHLKEKGPSVFGQLEQYPAQGASIGFNFIRPDTQTGFENKALYIYKYNDYKLRQVNWKN